MKNFRSNSTSTSRRRTKRSMQYYRLWIYSCNGVLGVTSVIFAIFAAFVLADVRLSLLGGVELYHPTFLYAYTALILQCGVVQTIGCLGAQRLSHKLLSVYWILLLLLTIGDVVVGLVWVFKLDKVKLNLRPVLTREFNSKYSTDESFTRTWNKVQSEEHCCGVDGPLDYDNLSRVQSQHSTTNSNSGLVVDVESSLLSLPESCCIVIYDPSPVSSGGDFRDSLNKTHRSPHNPYEKEQFPDSSSNQSNFENQSRDGGGDNRRNTNITHPNYDDDDDGGGGGPSFSSDDFMLSDDSQLLLTGQSEISSSVEQILESTQRSPRSQENSPSVQILKDIESGGLPLPLVSSSSLIKHKVRHGSHRWKLPSQGSSLENNTSSNSYSLVSSTGVNDTSVETSSEKSVFPEKKNKTKTKPKAKKLFPSFSFTPKSPSKAVTTTAEPEFAENLSVPFTCQRHPRILNNNNNKKNLVHDNHHEPYYKSNSNKESDTTNPKRGSNSETDITKEDDEHEHDAITAHSSNRLPYSITTTTSGTVELTNTNEIGLDSNTRDEENNDAALQSSSSSSKKPRVGIGLQEQSESSSSIKSSKSSYRKRSKRNSQVISEFSGGEGESLEAVVDSNPFSFLHSSAFTSTSEDDGSSGGKKNTDLKRKANSKNVAGSSKSEEGRTASELQAAYYFSASSYYQSNSYNVSLEKRFQVYRHGCGVKLIQWLDHVSGILFILGFCIIGFVKTCFLVILRTEIREMIEKIQLLEIDDPVSPSRALNKDQRLHHVSHPLLAHPHRASTVSAHAFNATLPTIKSPEGSYPGPSRLPKGYHNRRHSNVIGDRSQSHSQETVNMTLLVTNNYSGGNGSCASGVGGCTKPDTVRPSEKGRSNPNLSVCGSGFLLGMMGGREEFDPALSISVPNTSRYLRRSSTCSSSANPGPSYSSYLHYDPDKPGPSSKFYHQETAHQFHHLYHQHCTHGHYPRARPYIRNMSIGAVVHHSSSGGGGIGSGGGNNTGAIASASSATTAFRSFGGDSNSGGCSFSSRDENEILSASMENVGEQSEQEQQQSEDEKDKERREAEIRDWAAATACTDNTAAAGSGGTDESATPTVSLGDYTKAGFNHSSDSAESNDRQSTRRNGNNNIDTESIPLSYLGTAV